MSKHFFERLELGYKGEKRTVSCSCNLPWCDKPASKYKGVGQNYCEEHQSLMREYGGPARSDRHWSFNKKRTCEFCGHDPWQHPMVKQIDDELVRDRVAWGILIVDHMITQRDGGNDAPENCQTLCLTCNQIKTTLAGDSMPKRLYKQVEEYNSIIRRLQPHYRKLFGGM